MHTPSSPANLAWAHAMKAAISSWRVWVKTGSSSTSLERAEEPVDAVARIAVHPVHAPSGQTLQHVDSATLGTTCSSLNGDDRCAGSAREASGHSNGDRGPGRAGEQGAGFGRCRTNCCSLLEAP